MSALKTDRLSNLLWLATNIWKVSKPNYHRAYSHFPQPHRFMFPLFRFARMRLLYQFNQNIYDKAIWATGTTSTGGPQL